MAPSDMKYRPVIVSPEGDPTQNRWMVEGKLRRPARPVLTAQQMEGLSQKVGRNVATAQETREMENVEARVRHMDELGIDIQVVHSTIFIERVADSPEAEIAICKGYNRWLADIWRKGKGRLRWSCVLPLLSMEDALEELKFCKENGARAVFMRSIEDHGLLHDPYFFPLYEEASRLDLAIAVHIGNATPDLCDFFTPTYWKFRLASIGACHSLILGGVPALFPELRFGFLEASAYWIPGMLADLRERFNMDGRELGANPLRDNRVYVACQLNDDIPHILKHAGEDNLVIGTDYGHTDTSAEIEALRYLKKEKDISPTAINKMLDVNPRALYSP